MELEILHMYTSFRDLLIPYGTTHPMLSDGVEICRTHLSMLVSHVYRTPFLPLAKYFYYNG